jgi:hypothetical protein
MVEAVQAALAQVNAIEVVDLPDQRVRDEILALLRCLNQIQGAVAARIATFDIRDLARSDAQWSCATWLMNFSSMSKGAALRWTTWSRQLRQLPALAAALRAGTVSVEQVAIVSDLVRRVGIEQVVEYDQILADLCVEGGPRQIQDACARILALVDPDGPEPDPDEDFRKREVVFSQHGTTLYVRGRLDAEGGAALKTAVEALMKPPRAFDERTTAQRRADAVVDLARGALSGEHLPTVGGERPHVGVLVMPEVLFGTTKPADRPQSTEAPGDPLSGVGVPELGEKPWLNWVGRAPATLAQRVACDSVAWRLVLDPRTGLPLNVGRSQRIVPWWMRRALWARDRTCRWPGCDIPVEWTDAHHEIPWWQGGTTDIHHLISLCRYHHELVHEGQWRLVFDHATGNVSIIRPDGSPYELGPSKPWTSAARQGPQPTPPAHTTDPPWPDAA